MTKGKDFEAADPEQQSVRQSECPEIIDSESGVQQRTIGDDFNLLTANDQAQAENSTEAAKLIYPGEVTVNPHTGSANVQFGIPSFAGIDISLSFSALAATYSSPFRLPAGVNLIGIPFIHKTPDNVSALNFNGQDYYLDDRYASVLTEGGNELYYSGLKYQASKDIWFKSHLKAQKKPELIIRACDGQRTITAYSYELKVYDGEGGMKHFFFSAAGFCFAVVDKYFCNDTEGNDKYLTQLLYDNVAGNDVYLTKLVAIINSDGKKLLVNYGNSNKEIQFVYPVAVSETPYRVQIIKKSSEMWFQHSLNAQYDYRLRVDTDASKLTHVVEEFVSLSTTEAFVNRHFRLSYSDRENPNYVTQLAVVDGKNATNELLTSYEYLGDRAHNFSYGFDQAYDTPDINVLKSTYQTRERNGKQEVIRYFNKLSQEIKTEYRALTSTTSSVYGDLIACVINEFPKVVAYDRNSGTNRLVANYQFPELSYSVLYDKSPSQEPIPVAVSKKHITIGDFGNLLNQKEYPLVRCLRFIAGEHGEIALPEYNVNITPVTETNKQYDERFLLLTNQIDKDFSADRVRTTTWQLNDAGTNVVLKQEQASDLAGKNVLHLHTTEYHYGDDTQDYLESNYVNKSTLLQELCFLPTDPSSRLIKHYHYWMEPTTDTQCYGRLTITKTEQICAELTVPDAISVCETINGLKVKEISPTQLETTTHYDVSGQAIIVHYPEGVSEHRNIDFVQRLYTSTMVGVDGDATYLNTLKEVDFLNQLLFSRERCESGGNISTYQTAAHVYDYSLGGKVVTNIDSNGNKEELSYDTYRGLLSHCRYWQKKQDNEFEYFGESSYDYVIRWYENAVQNCYLQLTEATHGEKGEKIEYKGLSKDIVYEQTRWVAGQLKSRLLNDYTLSGILRSSESYLPAATQNRSVLLLRDRKLFTYTELGQKELVTQLIFSETGEELHKFQMRYCYDLWHPDNETMRTFVTDEGEYSSYLTEFDLTGQERAKHYFKNGRQFSTSIERNAEGSVTSSADFANNQITNHYHSDTGLLTEKRFVKQGQTAEQKVTMGYNNFAQVCQQLSSEQFSVSEFFNAIGLSAQLDFSAPEQLLSHLNLATQSNTYDDQNRLKQVVDAQGICFDYQYFPCGNLKQIAFTNTELNLSGTIEYEYYSWDAAKPLQTNKQRNVHFRFTCEGFDFNQTRTLQYDLCGRVAEETSSDDKVVYTTLYQYDGEDRVIEKISAIKNTDGSSVLSQTCESYEYDVIGRLTRSEVLENQQHTVVRSYQYDNCSNITEQQLLTEQGQQVTAYRYNEINQLLEKQVTGLDVAESKTGKTTYQYDENGNLIEAVFCPVSGAEEVTEYHYNAYNQMVQVKAQGEVYDYFYYPSGHRAAKRHNNTYVLYLYGLNGDVCNALLLDLSASQVLRKIDSYLGGYRYIVDLVSAQTELQVGLMRLNKSTVTEIISGEAGTTLQRQSISDYGTVMPLEPHTCVSEQEDSLGYMQYPYLYGASFFDKESGLYYLNARYYSPDMARFIAQDNGDYDTVPNRYLYAVSNPIMNYDVTGHSAEGWISLAISAVITAIGLALAPATAGGSEALAMEATAAIAAINRAKNVEQTIAAIVDVNEAFLIPSSEMVSVAELTAATEAKEIASIWRQTVGNTLFFAGTDGVVNSIQQLNSGEDFSWASWGKSTGAGAISGLLFAGIYGGGIAATRAWGGVLEGYKPKLTNVALYTFADVGAHTVDTVLSNAFDGEPIDKGLGYSVLIGFTAGAAMGSLTTYGELSFRRFIDSAKQARPSSSFINLRPLNFTT
ncbi:RHS repeat-associated core domain-containing protein [Vibrio mimicus]|uniref:RHS repeat domain-containing protein n=1 Tax=Vibrio mimicus TaxID=674 RepID=UPI002F91DB73